MTLLVLLFLGFLIANLNYMYSSLALTLLAPSTYFLMLKNSLVLKYMISLIYVGGVVVFILYIPCLCVFSKIHLLSASFLSIPIMSRPTNYDFVSSFPTSLSVSSSIGLIFVFLLFFHPMNLFKISGSLRF